MAAYGVARAYKEDVVHIAYMSARFMTADPLLNFLLRDASGASLNSLQSRKDVALHRYTKALTDSIGVIASSLVLISFHRCTPHAAEASVVVQKFCPDPYWHVPWEDQPGTFDIAPDCVNTNLYYTVENALHTNRKQFMQGKPHYYIQQLDFGVFGIVGAQNPSQEAAKYLLAHISTIDPHVDKYAHFSVAHHGILQGSGWEYIGDLTISQPTPDDSSLPTSRPIRESWVLRGVSGLNERAGAAASNPQAPAKPGSTACNWSHSNSSFR